MQTEDILILLEEIIERVWRLENFLTEIEYISVKEDKKLIEFYKTQINGIKKMLEDPITELVINIGRNYKQYLGTYFNACSYFQTLHEQLRLFVSLPKYALRFILSLMIYFQQNNLGVLNLL